MAGSGSAHLRDDALLVVEDLEVTFPVRGGEVQAVSKVSLDVAPGETLGLVGESGCGKSTLVKAIMRLVSISGGSVRLGDQDVGSLNAKELRAMRPKMQMVFQDPISSLNPRRRVKDIVAEPLRVWGWSEEDATKKVNEMLLAVGMDPDAVGDRRPRQFSGGQCQRISIARALTLDPDVLVCDEPVSALDVSVQAQVLNVIDSLRERFGLTMLFIAHDLAVVKIVSDRVAVMYLGKLCEIATTEELYTRPAHPYTQLLLGSVPVPDPEVEPVRALAVSDETPSPLSPPSGCRFRTRCPKATEICTTEEPVIRKIADDHFIACHHPDEDVLANRTPDVVAKIFGED